MPVTVSPSSSRVTSAPIRTRMSRSASPACVVSVRPTRHVHPAARGHRQHHERRRVGQVGLDRHVHGADRRGTHASSVSVAGLDLDAVLAQARARSSRCGGARARVVPRGARRRPRRTTRRRAAAPTRTGSRRRRRCPPDHRCTRPVPETVNGSVPAAAVVDLARRDRAARRARRTSGGCARGGRRRTRPPRRPARPPAGRTASPCRPDRSRRLLRAGGRASPTSQVRSVSTREPRRGQRRRHQLGVARAQRPSYDGWAVGERGQHQRAVGQRLRSGQLDPRVHRRARDRSRPQVARVGFSGRVSTP